MENIYTELKEIKNELDVIYFQHNIHPVSRKHFTRIYIEELKDNEKFDIFLSALLEFIEKRKVNKRFFVDNFMTLTYLFQNKSFEEIAVLIERQEMKKQLENF